MPARPLDACGNGAWMTALTVGRVGAFISALTQKETLPDQVVVQLELLQCVQRLTW